MTEYRRILRLLKPKGIKGQLVAEPVDGTQIAVLEALVGLSVAIVPPTLRGVRQTTIAEAAPHARGVLLSLEAVVDATAAHELAGRYLLAAVDDLPARLLVALEQSDASCLGMTVTDQTLGLIGTIVEERAGIAQMLWVVQGSAGEVLVPAAADLIVRVGERDVLMNLPGGLLEINR